MTLFKRVKVPQPAPITTKAEIGNITSSVYIANKSVGSVLLDALSFYTDGYKYSKAYKSGQWNGKIRFGKYAAPYFIFPTGLLAKVLNILAKNNIKTILDDKRSKPAPAFSLEYFGAPLREYQEEVIEACVRGQRGIVQAATGGGKTLIFIKLIQTLGVNTLIIVKSLDLMVQTADRIIEALNIDSVGIIGAGENSPAPITIATFQSLLSMKEACPQEYKALVEKFGMLIVDEAHAVNSKAKAFQSVVESIPAYYRFAFTATPKRQEIENATDTSIIAFFGPIISNVTRKELVNSGYLVDCTVYNIPVPKVSGATREDYLLTHSSPQEAYHAAWEDYILNNEARYLIIQNIVQTHKEDQLLIICNSVVLAKKISDILHLPLVTGEDDKVYRSNIYTKFRSGEIKMLVASNIYSEGIDFPKLKVMIFAESFKSPILLIQRLGRTMRIDGEKDEGIVYDLADVHAPFFDEQAAYRKEIYKREDITCMIPTYLNELLP